jgi:hypothetical protein
VDLKIVFRVRFLEYTGCPKNGVLTVHYVVEEATVNVRKMFMDLFADLAVLESGTYQENYFEIY